MTEFKFACPVCGQHITADLRTSGRQLECPTCFQKIVVPQGPREGDTKFILSAAQPAKPRPSSLSTSTDLGPLRRRRSRGSFVSVAFGLAVLGVASGMAWLQREKLLSWMQNHRGATTGVSSNVVASLFVSPY